MNIKFCPNRMRLRKKMWHTPGTVYPDNLLIDKDVYIYAGSEIIFFIKTPKLKR